MNPGYNSDRTLKISKAHSELSMPTCLPSQKSIQSAHCCDCSTMFGVCRENDICSLVNVSLSAPRVSKQTSCPWNKGLPFSISPIPSHSSTVRPAALHQAVCGTGIFGPLRPAVAF